MKTYGKIEIVGGEPYSEKPREVAITGFARAEFKDHRFVTVAETEEATYVIQIENLVSSGRCPTQNIHLTEESLTAVLSTVLSYMTAKGASFEDWLKQATKNAEHFDIEVSDNLNASFLKTEGDE